MYENKELAMCGWRCDLCKAYAPNLDKNDHREALAKMWSKYCSDMGDITICERAIC